MDIQLSNFSGIELVAIKRSIYVVSQNPRKYGSNNASNNNHHHEKNKKPTPEWMPFPGCRIFPHSMRMQRLIPHDQKLNGLIPSVNWASIRIKHSENRVGF